MRRDPESFKREVLTLAELRGDKEFVSYVLGVTDRMWQHTATEEGISPKAAEERLFSFYQEDRRFFKGY